MKLNTSSSIRLSPRIMLVASDLLLFRVLLWKVRVRLNITFHLVFITTNSLFVMHKLSLSATVEL